MYFYKPKSTLRGQIITLRGRIGGKSDYDYAASQPRSLRIALNFDSIASIDYNVDNRWS